MYKRILIRNVKFSRYCIYMDTIEGNVWVCIRVPFTVLFVRNAFPDDKDFNLSQQKGIAIILMPKIKQNENYNYKKLCIKIMHWKITAAKIF